MATSAEGRNEDRMDDAKSFESIQKQLTDIQQAQEQQIEKSKWERVPAVFSAAIQGLKFLIDILRNWF